MSIISDNVGGIVDGLADSGDAWPFVRFGDLAEIRYGKAKPPTSGTVPVIGSGGSYDFVDAPLVDQPTLVIGRKGTAGTVWLQEAGCWPSDTTFYVDWRTDKIENRFAYYWLLLHPPSHEHARTTLPSLPRPDLENHLLPLPPIEVQQTIVAALSSIEEATASRRRELALERERKAALMHHLFTHGTRGEPTKQTEIGEMPESWYIARLADIAQISYGLTVNQARRESPDIAPYLTVANVTRGALRLDDIKPIGMLNGDANSYQLHSGDVLFVEGSGNPRLLGSAAVWNDELPFALHQNHLIRARPDQERVLPIWIMSYFNSDGGRSQVLGKATTSSGLHNINSRLIASLQLPLPQLDEQREIVSLYDLCDARIRAAERELESLAELFAAMLDDLMSIRLPLTELSNHSSKAEVGTMTQEQRA